MIYKTLMFVNRLQVLKIITLIFFLVNCLGAQLDPSVMSRLSTLNAQEREQLANRYQGFETERIGSPDARLPSVEIDGNSVEVDQPSKESFDDRSDFLRDLNNMESVILSDIKSLELELYEEDTSGDNELVEALEESRALLRKIKVIQRREIEKRAEEYAISEFDAVKPFGYDLFAATPTTFAPGNEVPMPTDYRVGPGDLVEIQLFGQENLSYSLLISRQGLLQFPGIGPINAFEKGTSFVDLKNHLKEKILENFGAGVQSSIGLGAFRSIRIFLMGEVRTPGSYTVSALSTMINALLASGGVKETGSLRNIQLKRSGKVITTLDLYDLLLKGDTSQDDALQSGDVIFVPVLKQQVSVTGAVRRPAKFEIFGGETLAEVVELAGGTEDNAFLDFIRLERLDSDFRPVVKNLDLRQDSSFAVLSGDSVSVGFATSSIKNTVSLVGACERVGDYEWKENLSLADLIDEPMDLLPNVDLSYALVRRKLLNGSVICQSFAPKDILSKKSDFSLHKQDIIYFFSKEPRNEVIEGLLNDLRMQSHSGQPANIVRVSGIVHFPGEYPLTKKMTIKNLLDAAGGPKDSAYVIDAELTRTHVDSYQKSSVEHIRIDQSFMMASETNETKPFFLQPYDSLSIKPIPLWNEGESIEILGAVNFPGIYSIKSGETLRQIILRAGGLTNRAFIDGAIFTRENLRIKEDQQRVRLINQLESDLANATLAAANSDEASQAQAAAGAMLSRLKNTNSQGRMVINLGEIIKEDENSDLSAKDGDRLFIPEIPYAVSVVGEVQFPTSHLYEKNLSREDYLNRSGGYTQNADEDRTFVVKANGSVLTNGATSWFAKGSKGNLIDAGDVIVVPLNVRQTRFLENLTYGTQIIYQLAVAAAAVNSF